MKNSKKAFSKIILGAILLVIITILSAVYVATAESTIKAQLEVESGIVKVNGNTVAETTLLEQNDIIETAENSIATVILHESIIIILQPNTKVKLEDIAKEHPRIKQEQGTTWNKLLQLAGITQYTVQTANSIASVRGTAFEINDDKIVTAEGEVTYTKEGQTFSVTQFKAVEKKAGRIMQRDATEKELENAEKQFERTIKQIERIRLHEIQKQSKVLKAIMQFYDLSDEKIKQGLADADNGKLNIDEIAGKSPIKTKSITKISDLTKSIKKIKQDLELTKQKKTKK